MGHMINGVVAIDNGLGKCVMESGGGGVSLAKFKKRRVSAVRDFPPGCGRKAQRVNRESNGNPPTGDVVENLGGGGGDGVESPYLSKALLDEITKAAEDSARMDAEITKKAEDSAKMDAEITKAAEDSARMDAEITKEAEDSARMDAEITKVAEDSARMDAEITKVAEDSARMDAQEPVPPEKPTEEESNHLELPITVDAVPETDQKKVIDRQKVSAYQDPVRPEKPTEEESSHLELPITVDAVPEIAQKKIIPRRKVSAFRDFPPGCGRNAVRVDRDFPPGCGRNAAGVGLEVVRKSVDSSKIRGLGHENSCEDDNAKRNVRADIEQRGGKVQAGDSLKRGVNDSREDDNAKRNVRADIKQGDGKVQAGDSLKRGVNDSREDDIAKRNVRADIKQGDGKVQAGDSLKRGVDDSREDDIAKRNVRADIKPGGGKVQAGDSLKRGVNETKFGDKLQLKSEGIKKQRTEQFHHKETSTVKHSHDSSIPRSEFTGTKTVNKVGGSSGGKSGLEALKLNKDMSFKRKVPENSTNETPRVSQPQGKPFVGSFEDREVVQSIMARPNCPWGPGKKTSTPIGSDRLQEDHGKRTFKSVTGKESQSEQGKKIFRTPDGSGSQSEQGKKIFKPSTGTQSGASISRGSKPSEERDIVISLAAARNCPWRLGKRFVKLSGAKPR